MGTIMVFLKKFFIAYYSKFIDKLLVLLKFIWSFFSQVGYNIINFSFRSFWLHLLHSHFLFYRFVCSIVFSFKKYFCYFVIFVGYVRDFRFRRNTTLVFCGWIIVFIYNYILIYYFPWI